jgi:hypothetical protein
MNLHTNLDLTGNPGLDTDVNSIYADIEKIADFRVGFAKDLRGFWVVMPISA